MGPNSGAFRIAWNIGCTRSRIKGERVPFIGRPSISLTKVCTPKSNGIINADAFDGSLSNKNVNMFGKITQLK